MIERERDTLVCYTLFLKIQLPAQLCRLMHSNRQAIWIHFGPGNGYDSFEYLCQFVICYFVPVTARTNLAQKVVCIYFFFKKSRRIKKIWK